MSRHDQGAEHCGGCPAVGLPPAFASPSFRAWRNRSAPGRTGPSSSVPEPEPRPRPASPHIRKRPGRRPRPAGYPRRRRRRELSCVLIRRQCRRAKTARIPAEPKGPYQAARFRPGRVFGGLPLRLRSLLTLALAECSSSSAFMFGPLRTLHSRHRCPRASRGCGAFSPRCPTRTGNVSAPDAKVVRLSGDRPRRARGAQSRRDQRTPATIGQDEQDEH